MKAKHRPSTITFAAQVLACCVATSVMLHAQVNQNVTGNLTVGGKLGIGTSSPLTSLDVRGNGMFLQSSGTGSSWQAISPALVLQAASNGWGDIQQWKDKDGNPVAGVEPNGMLRLGMATSDLYSYLDNYANFGMGDWHSILAGGSGIFEGGVVAITGGFCGGVFIDYPAMQIWGPPVGSYSDIADFWDGNWNQVLTLNNEGKLGLGTATPQATLDVQGDARFSGAIRVSQQGDLDMGLFVHDPTLSQQPSMLRSQTLRQQQQDQQSPAAIMQNLIRQNAIERGLIPNPNGSPAGSINP